MIPARGGFAAPDLLSGAQSMLLDTEQTAGDRKCMAGILDGKVGTWVSHFHWMRGPQFGDWDSGHRGS
jgi:hypothetical protein